MLREEGSASLGRFGGESGRRPVMAETALEAAGTAGANGDSDSRGAEPKATVLATEDTLSGKLVLKGSGQVLGNFTGQIECDGDLFVGPEAHVEADIKSNRVTVS